MMEEELYGLGAYTTPSSFISDQYYYSSSLSTAAYTAVPVEQMSPQQAADYYYYYRNFQPLAAALRPDQMFSGSSQSGLSDAASTVATAGIQREGGCSGEEEISCQMNAKIASHPLYPKLLQAYIDCQKVGAPPAIARVLEEIRRESDRPGRRIAGVSTSFSTNSMATPDPDLDVFMETYCDMLEKYKSDLSRPFDEAITFLNKMETQLNTLSNNTTNNHNAGSSEEEDLSGGPAGTNEDHELKDRLLRKYSGYISTLKHEFSKKKKKGKLPKEARQVLFDWWNHHYKWPYPTEVDKITLAQVTGLDQKQINNWFINQRKRHWKPSESMQFAVMDTLYGSCFTNKD